MMVYVNEKKACRSQLIGAYFGDNDLRPCGICDNCLRKKETPITREEFDALHQQIINVLKDEPVPVTQLLASINSTDKEKAWQVIEFLQAENKIKVDRNGAVSL
jgi:ATP-dependent DNA helicase RecQ